MFTEIINNSIFWWGALGAFAPEIFILYRMRNGGYRPKRIVYYVFITLIFIVIGGLLAIGLQSANSIAAIYVGASWPANVGLFLGTNPGNPDKKLNFRQMLGLLTYRYFIE